MTWGHMLCIDGERYEGCLETREEAVAEGIDAYGGEPFYVIEGEVPHASRFLPSALNLIEAMNESARDEAGDCAEDFPDVGKDAEKELDDLLRAWASKHIPNVPFWIGIGDPERIEPSRLSSPPAPAPTEKKS